MPFNQYLELALYAPGLGYYSGGATKIGASGDFITAPEISPLFSRCLARQCDQILDELGGGDILEFGAGTGAMAADLLKELVSIERLPQRYLILEVSADLKARQKALLSQRVPQFIDRIEWLDELPETPIRGVILGNEVVDSIPVTRFRIKSDGPVPLGVEWNGTALQWAAGSSDAALDSTVSCLQATLGYELPQDYESEICLSLNQWMSTLADTLEAGCVLMIDYGYARREYYHPERNKGTLICHYRQRAHDNPLILPGVQDITANVDFSALADAGMAAGLNLAGYTSQAFFLFGCGLERLINAGLSDNITDQIKLSREVKLLTLPAEMGERFQAMAWTREIQEPLTGFSFQDWRGRL